MDFDTSGYQPTPISRQLTQKYRIKHFLALTEQGKEALWSLTAFILFTSAIAYFGAHFLLLITGYYTHPVANILITHASHLTK